MYKKSIQRGPILSVKPAQNFHEHVYLLSVNDYNLIYKELGKFPHVISVTLSSGFWNLLLTTDRQIDFSVLKGFDKCIFHGIKGETILSKVTSLNWNKSLKIIKKSLFQPENKTTLYEEIPSDDETDNQ